MDQNQINTSSAVSGTRSRVLMAAYACEPAKGSEPGVGWNWALQTAKQGHDVHVITRENNRNAIESAIRKYDGNKPHFHYVDFHKSIQFLKKKLGSNGLIIYYYLWQFLVARKAKNLSNTKTFDILHHVTFVIDWMPSGLAFVSGNAFLWGPVGGSTHDIPPCILRALPFRARIAERFRRTIQFIFKRFDPFLHLTMRKADRILTYTTEALAGIPMKFRHKAFSVVHIGINATDLPQSNLRQILPGKSEFKILSNGRMVAWKGFDILVRAFEIFLDKNPCDAQLYLTSDGPFRKYVDGIIAKCRNQGQIHSMGYLPTRNDVYQALEECDLYALMTCRDGPPVAVLEAMNSAKPILYFDMGACAELVPDDAGVKVQFEDANYDELVQRTARAIQNAYQNHSNLRIQGEQGRCHVQCNHQWDQIGDEISRHYYEILRIKNDKP